MGLRKIQLIKHLWIKSFSIVASISILAGTVFAKSLPTNTNGNSFGGIFGGVALNYLDQQAKTILDMSTTETITDVDVKPIGFDSIGGTAFLGYGMQFHQKWYLGIEGSYRYSNGKDGSVDMYVMGEGSVRVIDGVKGKNTYTGFVKGGYLFLPNVMGYLLLGVSSTEFEYKATDLLSQSPGNQSDRLTAFTPGCGLQMMLNKNFFLDARYTYTAFPKNNHAFAMSDNGANYTDDVSIKPTVSSVSLGIGYLLS